MDENKCILLLEKHGIKPTSNRIVIAKSLAACENPVSMKELEDQIITIDKSNIFRTLTLFRDNHLVHTVEDGAGVTKYELCFSKSIETDEDEHMHFFCERCHKTFCLYDMPIPDLCIPLGYQMHSVNFMIKGLCPKCSKKKQ